MNVDLVTVTPFRLRFQVNVNDETDIVILTNAQLVGFAIEPLKTILQRLVGVQADARQLLLGIGKIGTPFISPPTAIQPLRYCRTRIHQLTNSSLIAQLAIDATVSGGRADLNFIGMSDGDATDWIVDLETEHTLTR